VKKAIISVIGQDRPGILAAVSRILFEQACNIENVSQTLLQFEFAGIFIVTMPQDLSIELLERLLNDALAPDDLQAHVKDVQNRKPSQVALGPCEAFVISTKGPDRKGLVAGITEVIARYGANVVNLKAVFKGGDDPSANIMLYEVDIPIDIDQQAFYADLRQRARELGLEISIQHRNVFEAITRI